MPEKKFMVKDSSFHNMHQTSGESYRNFSIKNHQWVRGTFKIASLVFYNWDKEEKRKVVEEKWKREKQ